MPGQGQELHGKPRSKMQETRADLATQQCCYSFSQMSWILNKGDFFFFFKFFLTQQKDSISDSTAFLHR